MVLLYHFWQYRAYFSVRYCLKALRKEHGLTQEQLAEQLGVAANTIARIETGNRGISIDLAIELVVRFETTLDYIFLGRE